MGRGLLPPHAARVTPDVIAVAKVRSIEKQQGP